MSRFDEYLAICVKRYKVAWAYLLWNDNRKSYALALSNRDVDVSDDLE